MQTLVLWKRADLGSNAPVRTLDIDQAATLQHTLTDSLLSSDYVTTVNWSGLPAGPSPSPFSIILHATVSSVMETLPSEMVAKIAQYLRVKDLASCCAVSLWWREVFGCDEVWRPRCEADSEEYLRTTPCRVEPKFTSPESENSTLSPIGRWRTAYMREKHLWRNWVLGNFVKDEISNSCYQVVFINNDFLITVNNGFIGLIDATVEPKVFVAKLTIAFTTCKVSVVTSDTFIFWDRKNTVQVIGVDWELYALSVKHTFCMSEGEGISSYDIVNTLFVGLDKNLLHIWDLEKATKLKTESCLDGLQLVFVDHDDKCENLGVTSVQGNLGCVFRIYSVKEQRFRPFTKHILTDFLQIKFAFLEHYVALVNCSNIEIYNYQTSQCLHTFEILDIEVYAVGNSFMFCKKNRDLVQLSPATGAVTCLGSNIRKIWRISEKLYRAKVYGKQKDEVWKITPKAIVTLTMFPERIFFFFDRENEKVNQPCSKVLLLEEKDFRTYW